MMRRAALLTLFAFLVSACDRRDRLAAPDSSATTAPVPERSVYLSVSELSPSPGDSVIIAATVVVGHGLSIGSFKVRLGFDSTMLQFIEEIPTAGMMRVVNPQGGEVTVVGASSSAAEGGALFMARFRVKHPEGLNALVLRVDELNDTAFVNQTATIRRESRLMLDRSLASETRAIAPAVPSSSATRPSIDSISPRAGEVDRDRVTDLVIYGRGFAPRGNVVVFGTAEVPALSSERNGTIIRFAAPSVPPRFAPGPLAVRVRHGGGTSNDVTFRVTGDR